MLLLNQGPIYTPLILAAILVAFTRRSPLWLGMLLVAAAAYYARVTRFTWLFAPAIWAGLIAFLEIAPYGVHSVSQRWWRAILLALSGLLGGYVVAEYLLILPDTINGVDLMEFGELSAAGVSNMVNRQPLLWDRLWPNPTNPVGIVPGLLLATAPLTALLIYLIASRRWKLNLWQILALSIGLLGFLVVGIIVSTKIGGGSNLHNLDMFLITLVMLAALALEAVLVTTGKGNKHPGSPSFLFLPWYGNVLILATLLPSFLPTFLNAETIRFPADEEIERTLTGIQAQVDIAKEKGEVLFIDQRQLLTFGEISGVPLVQDYEKKRMMDLAMAEDAADFEGFYQDLAAHRFSLIIVEPLTTNFHGQRFHFGNENDAWVKWVSIPLLCYYEPVELYQETGILLLQPKEEKTAPAPGLSCSQF